MEFPSFHELEPVRKESELDESSIKEFGYAKIDDPNYAHKAESLIMQYNEVKGDYYFYREFRDDLDSEEDLNSEKLKRITQACDELSYQKSELEKEIGNLVIEMGWKWVRYPGPKESHFDDSNGNPILRKAND